ncbi:MAG: LysR family glycine cleavage system transcriptional activator, partial [Gammaproteobacteria bacterium]
MARRYYQLPSLTGINSFDACARHKSFTGAAAELGVTLGAVSRQIKALESELDQKLFHRRQRGVELTSEGEELFIVVSEGFQNIGNLCQSFKLRHQLSDVTLAGTTAFVSLWLMPRLSDFWLTHQDITLNHSISDNPVDNAYLNADIRIRYGNGNWPKEVSEKLFTDVIYPVCGLEFAKNNPVSNLNEMIDLPLLSLQSLDMAWTGWDGWFAYWQVNDQSAHFRRFNNYVVTLQAAQDNQGIALGWHSQVKDLIRKRKLCRLT